MNFDFDEARIRVGESTDSWGPYVFSFRGALPDPAGDPISNVIVKSFLGAAETTDDLIDGAPEIVSPAVRLKFKYPGETRKGKHVLRFTVTLAGGGENGFEFGYVEVE